MASPEGLRPHVLIFDDFVDDVYRELAQEGAEAAGWDSLAFRNVHDAMGHFDDRINALVTGLGQSGSMFSARFPAMPLLELSDKFGTPRALMSAHPDADKFIRPDSSDILIPKMIADKISTKVSGWLISLVQNS